MKKHLVLLTLSFTGAALTTPAWAADRYWACNSAWWDNTCWSSTLGGAATLAQPQNGDNVYLYQSNATHRTVNYQNITYPSAILNSLVLNATGSGTITLSQGGYNLTTLDETIGNTGQGSVNQFGGTHNVTNNLYLGRTTTGNGSFTVSDTGYLSAKDIYVGEFGAGSLTVQNGGVVSSSYNTYLGRNSGSSGSILVDGAEVIWGSVWDSSELVIGESGTGSLTVQNGGKVFSNDTSLGSNSGGSGSALVDGTGSSWNNYSLLIGDSGTGNLTVQNGGKVWGHYGSIGYMPGSSGSVLVDGPGSSWSNPYSIVIGWSGIGSLTVQNGGKVAGGEESYLGYSSGGSGTLTIDGAGSSWHSTYLGIGGAGTGSLTVQNGGVANVANILGISNTGTVNLNGGTLNTGNIHSGGTLAVTGSSDVTGDLANNTGGKVVVSGGATATFHDDVVHNGAEIRVNSGSEAVFLGAVSGAGSYTGTGTLRFEGGLMPGNSPALITVEGDMVLTSSATTVLELGGLARGSEYDAFDIGGTLTFGGTLAVSLYDLGSGLFSPSAGSSFDLFTAETLAGTFDLLTLAALAPGLQWNFTTLVDAIGTRDVLRVSVSATPVPVPAAAWLFGSGLLGLVGMARRGVPLASKAQAGLLAFGN